MTLAWNIFLLLNFFFFLQEFRVNLFFSPLDLKSPLGSHVTRRRDEIHRRVKFQSGVIFFRYKYLSLWAENWKFPPCGQMDIFTFLYDILFVLILGFYKNTDLLVSYNCQKISDQWYYKWRAREKEKSCAYRFIISRCCKYGLLALLQLYGTLRGNWNIKGNTEIYSLLLISKLNSQSFCSTISHLVSLTSQISYLQNVHCNKFTHTWLDKTQIA